ncbi:MAG TPA: ABC transporter substrate-binding protein [Bacteroidia bacterium]|nr:ABC transporter substrate-binding protein [Bacteroidia bacterium]
MRTFLLFPIIALLMLACNNEKEHDNVGRVKGKGDFMYGGTFRYNEPDKLQTLYPPAITDAISSHVASQVYEGLVKFNPRTMQVVGGIAESWKVDSTGTIYTFSLRKNVRFQKDACFPGGEGRMLAAGDVKYSLELLCKNDGANANFESTFKNRIVGANKFFEAGAAAQPGSLEGVRIIDPHTVEIRLENPGVSFLFILANVSASIVPKEAVEKYGNKMHVGSGPFMLAEIAGDTSSLVLVRNPGYYRIDSLGNTLPFLDSIRISFVNNKQEEIDLFEKDMLDFVYGLSSEAVKEYVPRVIADFEQKPPIKKLGHSAEFVTQFYGFNTTRPPFDNVKVRQAFSYAIDRNRIVEEVLGGEAYSPGNYGITPPALTDYKVNEISGYEQNKEADRKRAKRLLAEAGYPNGKGFPPVRLVVNRGGTRNAAVADEFRNQLSSILNVNVEISIVSFKQKLDDERYARTDMFRSAWNADYPSPESFLSLFYGDAVPDSITQPAFRNTTRYNNPEFDRLFDLGRKAATKEEAYRFFSQAEQLMMKDAPVIILWYEENYWLMQARVKNFHTNQLRFLDFSQVYIGEEIPRKSGDTASQKRQENSAVKDDDENDAY